jgi:signal-transduction protein with cAMP-binding, CBS, and nucleotidyltransferase domain
MNTAEKPTYAIKTLDTLPLPASERALLARHLQVTHRPSGTQLTSLRSPRRALVVLLSGTVEVRRADGLVIELDASEQPVFIGELTLLYKSLGHTADVVVTSETAVVGTIEGSRFDKIRAQLPELRVHLDTLVRTRRARLLADEVERRKPAIAAYKEALARTAPVRS